MRLAGFLMQKGFVLISIEPNSQDIRKNVFFFKQSIEIKTAISEYLANRV